MLVYVLDYQAEPDHSELPCCRMLYYHAAHRCHLGRGTGTLCIQLIVITSLNLNRFCSNMLKCGRKY